MKYYIFQFKFYKYLWFVNEHISLKYCIIVLLYGQSLLSVGDYLKTASYFFHQTLQVKLKIWLILLMFLNTCILQTTASVTVAHHNTAVPRKWRSRDEQQRRMTHPPISLIGIRLRVQPLHHSSRYIGFY